MNSNQKPFNPVPAAPVPAAPVPAAPVPVKNESVRGLKIVLASLKKSKYSDESKEVKEINSLIEKYSK